MNESKLKHSYSLTSLSSRFLSSHNNHAQPHHNGSHASFSNGGHHQFRPQPQPMPQQQQYHSEEPEGSDDYGFLSGFSESRSGQGPKSSLYSNYSTSTNPTRSIQNPALVTQSSTSSGALVKKLNNLHLHSHPPSCGCDCHGPGSKVNKLSCLDNGFANQTFGSRLLGTGNAKLNASCQALNSCSGSTTNNGGGGPCHNNTTNGLVNGNGSSSTNFSSLLPLNNLTSKAGSGSHNNNNAASSAGPGVRVRRTLSCYVKQPQVGNTMKSLLDSESASTLNVATASAGGPPKSALDFGYNPPSTSFNFNPICEFSPYSSLSSNDLLRAGTGASSGIPDRRFLFFHDNPIDCGCPSCFQVKLSIFQTTHKKPSPPITNVLTTSNNNANKEEVPSTTIPQSLITSTTSTAVYTSSKNVDSDITWPLTPGEAVGYFSSRLTSWELQEIDKFPQVWCVGHEAVRKINGDKGNPLNSAFDDDNGNYHKVTRDHLSYRYEILEVIGKGSFGQVVRTTDHKTQSQVAVKIIRNKKRFHAQALVEVKILEHLRKRDHDNTVIRMFSSFYFRNHLCIVFELMSLNLYELIRRNHYQGFSTGLIRKFAISLLKCLALLKRENIIHCDLKPENILLRKRGSSAIKVIDFGSSCFGHERVFSYIQSRFYRAPEVILGIPYTPAIDVWSLGCVLSELATGYPLFPGENEVEQLACIMETLGMPPDGLITIATRRRLFFDSRNQPRCIRNSKGRVRRPGSRDLATSIKSADLDFICFLRKCLTWDANDRISPEDGLNHPWITSAAIQPTIVRKNYV